MGLRNLFDAIHNEFRWPIIIALAILLYVNASGKLNIDFLLDRTPQENVNIFLNDIENINPNKTLGEDLSGISVYDEDRILYNMMYEMGQKEYIVYVFTKETSLDYELNALIGEYKLKEDSLNVYSLHADELMGTIDSYLLEDAPFVMKLTRDNSVSGEVPITKMTGIYSTPEEINTFLLGSKTEETVESVKGEGTIKEEVEKLGTDKVNNDKTLWSNIFGEGSIFEKLFKDGKLR